MRQSTDADKILRKISTFINEAPKDEKGDTSSSDDLLPTVEEATVEEENVCDFLTKIYQRSSEVNKNSLVRTSMNNRITNNLDKIEQLLYNEAKESASEIQKSTSLIDA